MGRKMYSVPKHLRGVNLCEAGLYYRVDGHGMSEECKKRLQDGGYEFDGDHLITIWAPDIERFKVPYGNVLWEESWYDQEQFDDILTDLAKPADHYLVFASGCRWDGASGYKFADSIRECISRNYDATIEPVKVSPGGKTLVCCESSHDVPRGSTTYIVALTNREYEHLRYAAFDSIDQFVQRIAKVG